MAITRPTSDLITTGWSTAGGATSFFDAVDETSPSDSDYVISSPIGSTNVLVYGIASLTSGTYRIRLRSKHLQNNIADVRVLLLNSGDTILVTSAWQTVTNSYTTYNFDLTFTGTATKIRIETQLSLPTGQIWLNGEVVGLSGSNLALI